MGADMATGVNEGNGLPQDVRDEIRKEVISQSVKWAIAAAAALALAALSGWWLYLEPLIIGRLGGVPNGAVVAFDLSDGCPKAPGWNTFADAHGRVIVGSGQGAGLALRPFRHAGGLETFTLTETNIPEHKHDVQLGVLSANDTNWGAGAMKKAVAGSNIGDYITAYSSPYGRSKPDPIPTMPPFINLVFCKKA
jgi:hypothetical protein